MLLYPPEEWGRYGISYHYQDLLEQALDLATAIIEQLPDSYFRDEEAEDYFGLKDKLGLGSLHYNLSDDRQKQVVKLTEALDRRRERGKVLRQIMAMENESGRTPEEAEMFRRKAAELRARIGADDGAGTGT